ncbi:MAG: response regulator transcription factor [Lachnospiraceae bacterium]|nr:response regulator transcription factor [Lachnospiraceae bacterium]
MAYQVLLVEDDAQIREVIEDFFVAKGQGEIELHIAKDGTEGLAAVYEWEYDLCLLDIMLPGADGFEVCRTIRENSIVPIIFLTARGREEDVLYGYQLGCDDYMVKPFSLAELYAKCQALIKRSKGMVACPEIVCGEIRLDPVRFTVTIGDERVDLPPKQYTLLKYLMENKERVLERELLLTRIWGYDYEGGERVVDNHIKKLRKALGDAGAQIKTVMKKGYKITD